MLRTNNFNIKCGFRINLDRSPRNDNCQQPQSTDNKQPRKQRAVNERAIYRPPPARSSGVLQETVKQNVDPGGVSIILQFPHLNSQQKNFSHFFTKVGCLYY